MDELKALKLKKDGTPYKRQPKNHIVKTLEKPVLTEQLLKQDAKQTYVKKFTTDTIIVSFN